MPKVVKEDIDKLNAKLSITVEKSDYEQQFKEELAKYRKQAHMKGFRRGKTPMSVVKKMYGKAVLGDVINQSLQKELINFINESKENLLGHPISTEDHEQLDFDWKDLEDYTFTFDLGIAPEFEIEEIGEGHTFTQYKVEVTDEMVDEDLQNARNRMGQRKDIEEDIQENDLVTLVVKELDEDKNVKAEGLTSDFSLLVKDIADEKLREEILSKKAGDQLELSLLNLEEQADRDFVVKNYLRQPDYEGDIPDLFNAVIDNVSRVEPAELNEEFFQNLFGDEEIKDEEAARAKMKEESEKFFDKQAEALLFREVQDHLMDQFELPLPDDFLKRWLLSTNENLNKEDLDADYPNFADNLRWTLIKNKLAKKYEIKIEEEDIRKVMRDQVMRYFAGSQFGNDNSIIENMVDRLMQDQKQIDQVQEEVLSDKLFDAVIPEINKEEKKISLDEFNEVAQKARAEAMAAATESEDASGEEE
jgi:trigger factor